MPPYCSRHAGYHDDVRYPNECAEMDAADRRRALAADRYARAERIAADALATLDLGEGTEGEPKSDHDLTRALQSGWIEGDTVRDLITAAALQALTESEQA